MRRHSLRMRRGTFARMRIVVYIKYWRVSIYMYLSVNGEDFCREKRQRIAHAMFDNIDLALSFTLDVHTIFKILLSIAESSCRSRRGVSCLLSRVYCSQQSYSWLLTLMLSCTRSDLHTQTVRFVVEMMQWVPLATYLIHCRCLESYTMRFL